MHGRRRLIVPVLLVVVAAAAGIWYLNEQSAQAGGPLTASGTIEAASVTVGPEVAGRVTDVLAAEADDVEAGEVLVRLDDRLLAAQRAQAEAAVAASEAGVAVAEAGVIGAEADASRSTAAVTTAKAGVSAAAAAERQATSNYRLLRAGSSATQLAVARRQVDQARTTWRGARDAYAALTSAAKDTPAGKTAKAQRDTARAALATAQAQYNAVAAGSRKQQVNGARAQIRAARAQVGAAKAQVAAAQAQADAAQARVDAARAQADIARAQLASARAGIGVLDAQLAKLTLAAPVAGTVLARAVEPGEVVTPGATLLQLADLEHLTLTVFVPEDRYGEVALGQPVTVAVDSFPGETFGGTVARISDTAEFTPRNVQTVEGRSSTVFAIDLALDPSGGRLKPGMPADVTFR